MTCPAIHPERGVQCDRPSGHSPGHWRFSRGRKGDQVQVIWHDPIVTKDDAPCCNAKRDALGRLPIGYCGPDCVRRPHA